MPSNITHPQSIFGPMIELPLHRTELYSLFKLIVLYILVEITKLNTSLFSEKHNFILCYTFCERIFAGPIFRDSIWAV